MNNEKQNQKQRNSIVNVKLSETREKNLVKCVSTCAFVHKRKKKRKQFEQSFSKTVLPSLFDVFIFFRFYFFNYVVLKLKKIHYFDLSLLFFCLQLNYLCHLLAIHWFVMIFSERKNKNRRNLLPQISFLCFSLDLFFLLTFWILSLERMNAKKSLKKSFFHSIAKKTRNQDNKIKRISHESWE